MSVTVKVNTYTRSVTYVAENFLLTFKEVIKRVGLDPAGFVGNWESNSRALRTWLESKHLTRLVLEIYNPTNGSLVTRWDVDVVYSWSDDNGNFWCDLDQLAYAIKKAGVVPSSCQYSFSLTVSAGAPQVAGWGDAALRSTEGFVRQGLGSTVDHGGLGGSTSYYRKA